MLRKTRSTLFICALLVPEYILAWAIRQRLTAAEISRGNGELCTLPPMLVSATIEKYSLTVTHGFFILMGGFHVFKRKEEKENQNILQEEGLRRNEVEKIQNERTETWETMYPLSKEEVVEGFKGNVIRVLLEEELQDRSKSDWIAKTIVVFQILWFVAQCIARGVLRLEITELELITLVYTIVNFGIYIA